MKTKGEEAIVPLALGYTKEPRPELLPDDLVTLSPGNDDQEHSHKGRDGAA